MLRKIDLVHLDGRIVHAPDDGCSAEGQPGQQRQTLEHQLTRRYRKVELAPGDVRELPEWRIARAPEPISYVDARCAARDDFDRRVLRGDDGKWREPNPDWLRASQVVQAKSRERDAEAAQMHNDRIAQRAGEQLAALMQAVTPEAPKKAPKGTSA